VRQSLQTRRDRSAASPPRTGTSRHLGVEHREPATDGSSTRPIVTVPVPSGAHRLQCTTGRWACERYGGRHRGQRGFVGAVERLAASRSDLPPPAHRAQPGGADSGPGQAGQCGNPCLGADCCHTAGRAGLRLAAPAADAVNLAAATGRPSSPRPAWFLLAAGPGAGAATEPGTWRHCQAHRSPCAADTPAGIPSAPPVGHADHKC